MMALWKFPERSLARRLFDRLIRLLRQTSLLHTMQNHVIRSAESMQIVYLKKSSCRKWNFQKSHLFAQTLKNFFDKSVQALSVLFPNNTVWPDNLSGGKIILGFSSNRQLVKKINLASCSLSMADLIMLLSSVIVKNLDLKILFFKAIAIFDLLFCFVIGCMIFQLIREIKHGMQRSSAAT